MKHGNKKNGFLFILCMLLSTLTFAQQRELTGTVKDNKGEPLPGVSILIKSNGTGTATDMDGKYALNVSTGDVLVFSFIGYKPQTIAIANQNVLNVVLEDDVEQLQEVVVYRVWFCKKERCNGIGNSYQTGRTQQRYHHQRTRHADGENRRCERYLQ